MHNGLKPSVRGLKGVGFNRPLPAPFNFERSYKPDGVNDIFSVPGMVGQIPPQQEFTFEVWTNRSVTTAAGYIMLTDNINSTRLFINDGNGIVFQQRRISDGAGGNVANNGALYTGRLHIVGTVKDNTATLYINGIQIATNNTWKQDIRLNELTMANVGYSWLFSTGGNGYLKEPLDEVRIYARALTLDEINLNYNSGLGENPCTTEHIWAWWKMNEFENLGSGLVNGHPVDIRDFGPNGFHLKGSNMITNPADPNYVLKSNVI